MKITPTLRMARGFSLVTAVFLLVVLSALGAAMVNISSSSQSAVALDVQGVRAYQAARAGIEWALYQQLRTNSCVAAPTSFLLPSGNTLSAFTVTVTCVVTLTPGSGAGASQTQNSTFASAGTTVSGIATANLLVGMVVSGTGIAAGTTIANIIDGSSLTLSLPTTQAGSGVSLQYRSPLDRWQLQATACNQPTSGACPNNTNNNRDYVQRVVQVQF